MKQGWTPLAEIARIQRLPLGAARRLAAREHWPMVFKQSEIVVLPPRLDSPPSSVRKVD